MSFLFLGLAFGFDPSEDSFSENDVVSTAAVNLGLTEGGITGTGRCGGGGAARETSGASMGVRSVGVPRARQSPRLPSVWGRAAGLESEGQSEGQGKGSGFRAVPPFPTFGQAASGSGNPESASAVAASLPAVPVTAGAVKGSTPELAMAIERIGRTAERIAEEEVEEKPPDRRVRWSDTDGYMEDEVVPDLFTVPGTNGTSSDGASDRSESEEHVSEELTPAEFAALLVELARRGVPGVLAAADGLKAGVPIPTLLQDLTLAHVEWEAAGFPISSSS